MIESSILWRRLDTPGHDACQLRSSTVGWQLDGTAVFRHDESPARLDYSLTCDRSWLTQQGHVSGWIGSRVIDLRVARDAGVWTLNGEVIEGLGECLDLDLAFTPATNLVQLRRMALAEGDAADAPVAWLDASTGTLELLRQRYERRSETTYWYEAPRFGYAALLEVTPTGFVRRYPGLWEADATQPVVAAGR